MLVVDAGHVEVHIAFLGASDGEDAGTELDASRLAEAASGWDDEVHARTSIARSPGRPVSHIFGPAPAGARHFRA